MSMNNTNPTNSKYKTQMCRHWEQTGNCLLGPKCHFAHGKEELRSPSDMNQGGWQVTPLMQKSYPEPMMANNNFSNNNSTPSNYKTVMCKYFQSGFCKYDERCNFAHGPEELRDTSTLKPRSMPPKMGGGSMNGGMGGGMNSSLNRKMMMSNQSPTYPRMDSPTTQQMAPKTTSSTLSESSISSQIAQTQIGYLIQQLETHHKSNLQLYNEIQNAKELLQTGNIQSAAEILNGVMQRDDKSPEDVEKYNSYVANIQQLGNQLYAQYKAQLQQQQLQQQQMQMQQYSGMPTVKTSFPSKMEGGSPIQQSPSPTYNMQTMQSGGFPQGKSESPTNGYYPKANPQFSNF